jgi:hypothetical protein
MNLGRLKSLSVVSDDTAATTEPTYLVSFVDIGTNGMLPLEAEGSLTGATAVVVIAAPAGDALIREVSEVAIHNPDTVARTITVSKLNVATAYPIITQTLQPGETLGYANGKWEVVTRATSSAFPIAGSGGDTMSREENVAGLSSAITLANEIRTDMIAHFANATRHTTGQQSSAALPAAATTLATLLALAGSELTLYAAHNTDAVLAAAWEYHTAQAANKALTSAVTPVTLQEAVTRLNDLKAKYNDHEDETAGHADVGTVAADQTGAADAAYGTTNRVPVVGALVGDTVSWAILNDGTGNVTGVSATAGAAFVDFAFSADPQNDAIISYMVMRPSV